MKFQSKKDGGSKRKRVVIKGPGYGRLIGLIFMVIMVGAVFYHMGQRARKMADPYRETVDVEDLDPTDMEQPEHSGEFTRDDLLSSEEERGLLSVVQDRFPLAVHEQKQAYYYLLNKTHVLTQDEIERYIDRDVEYRDFDRQPDIIRGAAVEVRGVLAALVRTEMDMEQSGFSHVFEGLLQDVEGRRYYFVVTEAPPPELLPGQVSVSDGRGARLAGYFLQIIQYETAGGDYVAAPLIVGKRLEPRLRPPASRSPQRDLLLMIMMIVVLLILTGGFLYLWHRRTNRHIRMTEDNLAEAWETLEELDLPSSEEENKDGEV